MGIIEERAALALTLAGYKRYTETDVESLFLSCLEGEKTPDTNVLLAIGAFLSRVDSPIISRSLEKWASSIIDTDGDTTALFVNRGQIYATNRRVLFAARTRLKDGYYHHKTMLRIDPTPDQKTVNAENVDAVIQGAKGSKETSATVTLNDFIPVSRDLVKFRGGRFVRSQIILAFNGEDKILAQRAHDKYSEIYLESQWGDRMAVIAAVR